MSYVDDIQKINKLAKEMLSHGMANSLDEAVNKAQDTLRKSGAIQIDLSEMNQNLAREQQMRRDVVGDVKADPTSGQVTFETPKEQQQAPADKSGITWQEAMAKNTTFVVSQFKELQNVIGVLTAEIQQLKRDAQAGKRERANFGYQPTGSSEQVINIDDEPAQSAPQTQQSEKKGNDGYSNDHPKQGGFTSDDVSITKVFDFSNK